MIDGKAPVFVVVDDPHGHVVPSAGVEIVGRRAMVGHFGIGRLAANAIVQGLAIDDSMRFNMGVDRAAEIRKREEFPRDIEPYSRKKARKSKQRMKGLRP